MGRSAGCVPESAEDRPIHAGFTINGTPGNSLTITADVTGLLANITDTINTDLGIGDPLLSFSLEGNRSLVINGDIDGNNNDVKLAKGTILLNGSSTNLDISEIAKVATLGGTGSLGGDILKLSGQITGGAVGAVGTLTVDGSMNGDNSAATWLVDLSDNLADRIDVGGALSLTGTDLNVTATGTQSSGSLIIASYGILNGQFSTTTGLPAGYTLDYDYQNLNQIALVSAVPEPGTVLPLAALLTPWFLRRNRPRPRSSCQIG